jgi:hypothetical protein
MLKADSDFGRMKLLSAKGAAINLFPGNRV